MVAMVAAGVFRRAEPPAALAGEGVAAGVGLVIAFFKGFAFVLAVHVVLLKSMALGRNGVCQ